MLPDPCDRWVDSPGGQKTSVPVETGKSLTSDYPVSCAAGRFGNSTLVEVQSGPWCSGICEAGFVCKEGTSTPSLCPQGHYCRRGTIFPTPCPAGTIGSSQGLTNKGSCVKVSPGRWSAAGAVQGVECSRGSYNPWPGETNQSACRPCPPFSTTIGEAATRLSDCQCEVGYFSRAAESKCILCTVGTDCTLPGVELTSLPLQPGARAGVDTTTGGIEPLAKHKSGLRVVITHRCMASRALFRLFPHLSPLERCAPLPWPIPGQQRMPGWLQLRDAMSPRPHGRLL